MQVVEGENKEGKKEDGKERVEEVVQEEEEEGEKLDLEKGQVGAAVVEDSKGLERFEDERDHFHVTMLQRLNPTNPLRIVINGGTRVATPSPSQTSRFQPTPPPPRSQPRSTPTPQVSPFKNPTLATFLLSRRRVFFFLRGG